MQKKSLIAVLILFIALSSNFAAGKVTGVGVFGSFDGSMGATGGGLGITVKMGSFPVLGLQYNIANSGSLALSCDYYIVDSEALGGPVTWFLGVGAFGGMRFSGNSADFGLRAPIGLQLWPIKKCEFYLAGVPVLHLLPSPDLGIGAELGFRIHF